MHACVPLQMLYISYFLTQLLPILVQIYYNVDSVHKA